MKHQSKHPAAILAEQLYCPYSWDDHSCPQLCACKECDQYHSFQEDLAEMPSEKVALEAWSRFSKLLRG